VADTPNERVSTPELRDYFRILSQRKWSATFVFILVVGGAMYLSYQQKPVYESEAQVLAPPPTAGVSQLGTPIVAGRDFEPADRSRGAIVINETMGRRYIGENNVVGKTILTGSGAREIVGIVKDVYTTGLGSIDPLMYEPVSGQMMPGLLLRQSSADDIQIIAAIAGRFDPRIRTRVEPLTAQLGRYLSPARTSAVLAGILGVVALALACVGMFGVFAYIARQRTREIGIRMALGARPAQIVRLVLGATCRPLLLGLMVGIVASAIAAQVMRRLLFGLSAFDPAAYAGTCALLSLAAIGATWVPARRAIRVDPVSALRYE